MVKLNVIGNLHYLQRFAAKNWNKISLQIQPKKSNSNIVCSWYHTDLWPAVWEEKNTKHTAQRNTNPGHDLVSVQHISVSVWCCVDRCGGGGGGAGRWSRWAGRWLLFLVERWESRGSWWERGWVAGSRWWAEESGSPQSCAGCCRWWNPSCCWGSRCCPPSAAL